MKYSLRTITSLFVFLMAGFLVQDAQAQQEANFELAERFTADNMQKMTGSAFLRANWLEDKDQFWYEWEDGEGKRWMFVDASRQNIRPLFDRENMSAQLSEEFNRGFDAKNLDLKEFDYDTDRELFTFHVDSIEFKYHIDRNLLEKGDSLEAEERERWATYSPDSTYIAFAREHDLYIMETDDPDSTEIRLTEDGERWYSFQADHGDTTSTERLRARVNWFEDSEKLYVKRQDWREVDELWVINNVKSRPELETYKYNMPGEDNHYQDEILVFDIESQEHVRLDTDKWPDQSLGGVYFSNGGIYTTETSSDHMYILRRNRTWDEVDVVKANTNTGETEVLWSEKSEPYFNVMNSYLGIINDGEEFIWLSERTGWGQLYRYDSEGNLQNRITDGHFMVTDVAAVDTTGQTVYFEGFGKEEDRNPNHAHYYKVSFDGSGQQLVTPENANHSFSISDSRSYFVHNASRPDMPTEAVLRDNRGREVLQLEEVDLTRLNEAGFNMPEQFSVKAKDGYTDLYGVMWKPADFDPEKKYPIISYVYPGPQVEPFPRSFSVTGTAARAHSLAQVGFVVVAMGNRGGSPLREKWYHNYGYNNLRDYALDDNRYGIEQLAGRHSYIDLDKVGIYGHSGGGFMSTAALLSYPDFYKVAVSSAGNHDNNIYNIWWSEFHHGVDAKTDSVTVENENGEEVKEERTTFSSEIPSNAELADNLQGRLLLVHGAIDNNVHPAHTYRVAEELLKAGKRFDMMIFPEARHGFGRYSDYFERMLWDYFAEHLLGYYPEDVDYNLPD
ncbi:S9 family peptidase [Rhodohalobacter barkolensis]|nr:DPP IV N-terminal domain-containing protein [Rhodohalobacter barkolensis]